MKVEEIFPSIVKIGICLYGAKEYRVFVCQSNVFPGTGDYEDETEICEDREINCYCVWFEDYLAKDNLKVNGGYYLSLSEAIQEVESSVGFRNWTAPTAPDA